MKTVDVAITGREESVEEGAPYGALVQFYRAFNTRDILLMAENWEPSDNAIMNNPLGGICRGWAAIRAVYERVFRGPAVVQVEFYDYTIHETPELFYGVGRERGRVHVAGEDIPLAIRTSRIFRKSAGHWRQVHHHGSIDDAGLLARYQAAVRGERP